MRRESSKRAVGLDVDTGNLPPAVGLDECSSQRGATFVR
jgi:hypothetical protein